MENIKLNFGMKFILCSGLKKYPLLFFLTPILFQPLFYKQA
jgi:hypothetical protein